MRTLETHAATQPPTFLLAALAAFTLGCGGEAVPGGEASASGGASPATRETGVTDPCVVLETVVSDAVSVDPGAITFEPGGSTNPYCEATWRKANADGLEAQQGEAVGEYMSRRMEALARGEEFDETMPSFRVDATILLTITGREFPDEAAAVSALESVIGNLAEGITVEAEGREATFQADYDALVTGIGAKAAWSTRMSQLSVATGARMFHLSVRVGEDPTTNRDLAEVLALEIVAAL